MLVEVTIIESLNTDHKNDSKVGKTCLTRIVYLHCTAVKSKLCPQVLVLNISVMRHFKGKISNYILNQDIGHFVLDNQMKNDSMMQNYVEELNVKLTKKFSL